MSEIFGSDGYNSSYSGARARAGINYSVTDTPTSVTIKWTCFGQIKGGYGSQAKLWGTNSDGETSEVRATSVPSGGYKGEQWNYLSSPALAQQTKTINKTTSSQTFTITAKYQESNGYSSDNGDVVTCSITITIPALASYTITYKPGDYSIGSEYTQTKYYGRAITLKDIVYTRAGYVQDGWSINKNGSTLDYELSESYTTNSAKTLYPHWKVQSKSKIYNNNSWKNAIVFIYYNNSWHIAIAYIYSNGEWKLNA